MFQITSCIWQGPFASRPRLPQLQRFGITHLINVGESPSQLSESEGPFARIVWLPVEDLVVIPTESAIQCLDAIHNAVCAQNGKLYIHCVAGWNRSPTFLWLYFVACGIAPEIAKDMICRVSYDAVPAHPKLIDDRLVASMVEYGRKRFLPHPRPEALLPAQP